VLARQAEEGLKVVETINLPVSTKDSGGLVNIPFIVKNANATEMNSIFWIETLQRPDGSRFLQLQYTQTVLLVFDGVEWVATLIKRSLRLCAPSELRRRKVKGPGKPRGLLCISTRNSA